MKRKLLVAVAISALTAATVFSQPVLPQPQGELPARVLPARALKTPDGAVALVPNEAPKLTKFDLDFPGGTPKQLVAAIEKATGRPLNVVIPEEYANEEIPALRMTQVNVQDLFQAMEQASIRTERYRSATYFGGGGPSHSYSTYQTSISFRTGGRPSDDAIWFFRGREMVPDYSALETRPLPQKLCRFYALSPYLDQGLKVEDITTAIQTGWKMLGEKETPSISFHKETRLLIAVGEASKLEMIDSVLNALRPQNQPLLPPVPGSFAERVNTIIQRSQTPSPSLKSNAPVTKPAAAPESAN